MGRSEFLALAALVAITAACDPTSNPDDSYFGFGKADRFTAEPTRALDSREYKVLLDPAWIGDGPPAEAGAEIITYLSNAGFEWSGDIELDKERWVAFYDAPGSCPLRSSNLSLRDRVDRYSDVGTDPKRRLSLKYRSQDRFLASARNLEAPDTARIKFEEDIVPPYLSKYSLSARVDLDLQVLNDWEDILAIFGTIDTALIDTDMDIAVVGNFVGVEDVYILGETQIGDEEVELKLSLWYAGAPTPAVAEVSFAYDIETESELPIATVAGGITLFDALKNLPWRGGSSTKTAFAYGYDPDFCVE